MVNIRGYLSSNFTKSFLTIFLPVYFIVSMVFLIQISSLTAKINLTFYDLLKLYMLSLPEIVFYTLPLSFITALSSVLGRLSQDNELIALHSLGIKAKSILKGFFILALLFSLLLLSISFITMPLGVQAYNAFKTEKRAEASFNIIPGKIGQKFGDFYIYVKDKDDKSFQNLVIYNQTKSGEEQFFSSQKGELLQEDGTMLLKLTDGYGYTYTKNKLQEAQYKELKVYDQNREEGFEFKTVLSYWAQGKTDKKRMHKALFNLFISLIPLLSVYLIAAFTIINPRYQKNHTILTTFVVVFILYLIASVFQKNGNLALVLVTSVFLWLVGRWLFNKRVSRYF
ncbi:LptF/LptG family permease [Sulfurovum sp. zt1-1]|uniref:LptF/LptG family permease n=1 Tax=Sulfurovum zhangzhouensis TaxID=3019067 RepID=A0ABT7QXU4_9BACT|nr:LptF/LptG family permease [Sulfurovum zhangzhouensis]MDM5271161.1 LptF/LptG family permease [Sulfurovum zhangzhouensis]